MANTVTSYYKSIAVIICFTLLVACSSIPNSNKSESSKPNIILIMTDDQGWGDLSRSGNHNLNTPNIDALATNGVSFENFYVQPVCSPTRAELLTGRYYSRMGVYSTSAGGERINIDETTIADVLKKSGYHTAVYGKWHNGMQAPYHPNARGFDDFYGFASGHWGNYFSPMLERNGQILKGEGFLPDDLTNKSLEFISKHKTEPFFLYLPYNTPHGPMQLQVDYWERFESKELLQTYHGQEKEESDFTRAALAMVENIDDNIGRIIKRLEDLEIEENTIVIFMSDNGPNEYRWNGNMRGRKGSTDEGGVRTPFFMQWKKRLKGGREINDIASAIDILPTLIDITDSEATTAYPIDGVSLLPVLMNDQENLADRLIYNHWNGRISVRSQEYRLDHEDRLYNIAIDRGQDIDLSDSLTVIRESLIRAKTKWLDEIPMLTKDTDDRALTLGHSEYIYTQIPARDGIPHGNIVRSNRWPNDSYFTNWKDERDSITWDIDILEDGKFLVELYYTLAIEDVGVKVSLSHGAAAIDTRITTAHNPPLYGMEYDRYPRKVSYVKDFKSHTLGEMYLEKGKHELVLKAIEIPGLSAMDVRLLMFTRL